MSKQRRGTSDLFLLQHKAVAGGNSAHRAVAQQEPLHQSPWGEGSRGMWRGGFPLLRSPRHRGTAWGPGTGSRCICRSSAAAGGRARAVGQAELAAGPAPLTVNCRWHGIPEPESSHSLAQRPRQGGISRAPRAAAGTPAQPQCPAQPSRALQGPRPTSDPVLWAASPGRQERS